VKVLTVYLIGVPGAGKTTLMRALTVHCARQHHDTPVHRDVLLRGGLRVGTELGRHRRGHAGTDALSYNAAPYAAQWLTTEAHGLVLGEGDRLACATFLDAARAAGTLILVHLDTPLPMADVRRRTHPGRKPQAPNWLTGRVTKTSRLAADADLVLDGSRSPLELARTLRRMHPALANLAPAGLRSAP
jgi:hypothetical protein